MSAEAQIFRTPSGRSISGKATFMRSQFKLNEYEFWDRIPLPIFFTVIGFAIACALIGLIFHPFMILAKCVYAIFAIGLILYGLVGCSMAPFQESFGHGLAYIFLAPIYPIYYTCTRPDAGRGAFINIILGFGLLWLSANMFPLFEDPKQKPQVNEAGPKKTTEEKLQEIGPKENGPVPPGVPNLIATLVEVTKVLTTITDAQTAKKAAPVVTRLWGKLRSDYESTGERTSFSNTNHRSNSISEYIKFGPEYRRVSRKYTDELKRVSKIPGVRDIIKISD